LTATVPATTPWVRRGGCRPWSCSIHRPTSIIDKTASTTSRGANFNAHAKMPPREGRKLIRVFAEYRYLLGAWCGIAVHTVARNMFLAIFPTMHLSWVSTFQFITTLEGLTFPNLLVVLTAGPPLLCFSHPYECHEAEGCAAPNLEDPDSHRHCEDDLVGHFVSPTRQAPWAINLQAGFRRGRLANMTGELMCSMTTPWIMWRSISNILLTRAWNSPPNIQLQAIQFSCEAEPSTYLTGSGIRQPKPVQEEEAVRS
jgi:hypothetical protein